MPSFENCLQIILEEISLSDEDRQSFHADAQIIRNELMERMKAENKEFKDTFDGLSMTGSVLDKLKIDLPEEFDMDMKLKFPFKLTPHADQQRPWFVTLVAKNSNHRFFGRKGKMVRYILQMWVRKRFLNVIEDGIKIPANGRWYLITYPTYGRGSAVAHTVKANEIGGTKREISFDFVPAFEFTAKEWPFKKIKYLNEDRPWFAIPFGKKVNHEKERSNKYTFKVSAPFWERDALHDKKNLKPSLRLMKALRDAREPKLVKLASYTLKSVYLQEIGTRQPEFWERPMGEILIAMLKVLLKALEKGCLPFFLHRGFNQLNLLPEKLMDEYEAIIKGILEKLEMYRDSNDVDLRDIRAIFVR